MAIARMCFRFVFPLVSFFVAQQPLAEIYKCPQSDGLIKFSDRVCADGKDEAIILLENSPLDNTAERANIAKYQQQQILHSRRKSARQMPQMLLIEDTPTVERNAKITAREHPKKKRKAKAKKRGKPAAAKTKKASAGETTH
jgi:hypothetical protein